jgi:pyruvate dehydrogenase E1 component beta subunit
MGAHHSQSLEAWLTHVPGLKVVMPSNPADARGLLKSAIRDDNPVIFIEHRGLYWSRGQVPEGDVVVPIGKASIVREGKDLTVVALANMLGAALAAAEELSGSGISVEVIDPRSLSPLDIETIAESVKKTSRLVIVHEAVEQGGIAAEIIAQAQQAVFYYLDSPILRVAAPLAPVPASPVLEKSFVPDKKRIILAARQVLGKHSVLSQD